MKSWGQDLDFAFYWIYDMTTVKTKKNIEMACIQSYIKNLTTSTYHVMTSWCHEVMTSRFSLCVIFNCCQDLSWKLKNFIKIACIESYIENVRNTSCHDVTMSWNHDKMAFILCFVELPTWPTVTTKFFYWDSLHPTRDKKCHIVTSWHHEVMASWHRFGEIK